MWELIQIYMGDATVVDFALSYTDCIIAAATETYVADGMATFICEVRI